MAPDRVRPRRRPILLQCSRTFDSPGFSLFLISQHVFVSSIVLHHRGYLLPRVETRHYGFHLEARSHRIQRRDSNPGPPGGNRLRCHLSYRALVINRFVSIKFLKIFSLIKGNP